MNPARSNLRHSKRGPKLFGQSVAFIPAPNCVCCGRFVAVHAEDTRWIEEVGDFGTVLSVEFECGSCWRGEQAELREHESEGSKPRMTPKPQHLRQGDCAPWPGCGCRRCDPAGDGPGPMFCRRPIVFGEAGERRLDEILRRREALGHMDPRVSRQDDLSLTAPAAELGAVDLRVAAADRPAAVRTLHAPILPLGSTDDE